MASIQHHPRYFMRDCSRVPARRLTPAGKFWLGYLAGVTVCVVSVIVLGYLDATISAIGAP